MNAYIYSPFFVTRTPNIDCMDISFIRNKLLVREIVEINKNNYYIKLHCIALVLIANLAALILLAHMKRGGLTMAHEVNIVLFVHMFYLFAFLESLFS